MKNQAEANNATDVAEEMLQCSKVRLPGIMHVKTDLLNGKLGGGRKMEYPNIADGDPVAHEV